MSRKQQPAPASVDRPLFKRVDGKPNATCNTATGEGGEAFAKWFRGRTRTALGKNIEAMRAAASLHFAGGFDIDGKRPGPWLKTSFRPGTYSSFAIRSHQYY